MTKKDFFTLSIGLKAAYPRFTFLATDEEMEFWYRLLQDIDYEIAENAVMEHISTNVFPPSIAEIRKLSIERCKRPVLSFDEAWGIVQRAISTYGSYHPQEAFATMDDLTLSVVRNLGWTKMCQSENPEASRANFRIAYEEKSRAVQNQSQLPQFVVRNKAALQEQYMPTFENKAVPQIETKEEIHEVKNELTPDQWEARSKMIEEARRRILSGRKTE